MITENELLDDLRELLDSLDEDSLLEICNNCLETDYKYDDIVWGE